MYPFIIEKAESNYAAVAEQFSILITADSREELGRNMPNTLAAHLFEMRRKGLAIPAPITATQVDTSDFDEFEIVMVEPAPTNPVSLKVAITIEASGLTQAEIAERMETTQSVISRLADPFYWGHTIKSLSRLAKALGRKVEIDFPHAA